MQPDTPSMNTAAPPPSRCAWPLVYEVSPSPSRTPRQKRTGVPGGWFAFQWSTVSVGSSFAVVSVLTCSPQFGGRSGVGETLEADDGDLREAGVPLDLVGHL